MDETWAFDGKKHHDLNAIATQLNDLLKGNKLTVSSVELAPYRDRPLHNSGWDKLNRDVEVRRGSEPKLVIHTMGGIHVPTKPIKHDGKKYSAEIAISGDHITIYAPHLEGDPKTIVELNWTITAVGRHR